MSDSQTDHEIHAFARRLGLKRAWQTRGYLVPPPTMAEVRDFIHQWKLKEI